MIAKVVLFTCLVTFVSSVPISIHEGVQYVPSAAYAYAAPAVHHIAKVVAPAPVYQYHHTPTIVKHVEVEPIDPNPSYSFSYGVNDPHTGDNKHAEETLQNGVVHGSYSLVEPDGTLRKVTYTADKVNGFNAVVEKSGVPKVVHAPVKIVAPAPVYHAAPIYHAAPVAKFVSSPVYASYHNYHH